MDEYKTAMDEWMDRWIHEREIFIFDMSNQKNESTNDRIRISSQG